MADIKALGVQLVNLTVKEVNELATYLKDEYKIEPAAAAVAVAAPAGGGGGAAAAEVEDQLRRDPEERRRQQARCGEAREGAHRPRPQGGEGSGRRRSQAAEGRREQGLRRDLEAATDEAGAEVQVK